MLSYVVEEFIAERTGSVSQLEDLHNGCVMRVFINMLCTSRLQPGRGWYELKT